LRRCSKQELINSTFLASFGSTWSNFKSSIETRLAALPFADVIELVRTADVNQNLWAQAIQYNSTVTHLESRITTLESRMIASITPLNRELVSVTAMEEEGELKDRQGDGAQTTSQRGNPEVLT
jgi:hypothetical protein